MKLTDIMFNLDYLAANTGATKAVGGNIFAYETVTADASGNITLKAAPVPVVTNGTAYVWYRKASENVAMTKKAAPSATVAGFDANTEYCVMYRKAVNGEVISISSQFIPDSLHAVLTVALYSGDSCNVESSTKAGEVVIDIPRLQLSGASEISMSATGAAQTPLEGNALASGCTGCDGKAIYATITKFLTNSNWYDNAQGLVIEDLSGLTAPVSNKEVVVYAYYADKAPRKLAKNEWTLAKVSGDGTLDDTNKTISATAAGTIVISATAKDAEGTAIAALTTNKAVIIA